MRDTVLNGSQTLRSALQVDNTRNEAHANSLGQVEAIERELRVDGIPRLPIDPDRIHRMVRALPTGKAVGYSGIPNECLKYGLCENLVRVLESILDRAINYAELPVNLNMSVVKPVPKTGAKDLADMANHRPIAISVTEPASNIYI